MWTGVSSGLMRFLSLVEVDLGGERVEGRGRGGRDAGVFECTFGVFETLGSRGYAVGWAMISRSLCFVGPLLGGVCTRCDFVLLRGTRGIGQYRIDVSGDAVRYLGGVVEGANEAGNDGCKLHRP